MHTCGTETFSGCAENQSGQRFLDSSDPRLIRHGASTETAGGGTIPSPAGKDEKLSREFEGGALIGRNAPVPSSLDEETNNRHKRVVRLTSGEFADLRTGEVIEVPQCYRRPVGRGKYCGRMSIAGVDPNTGRRVFRRINCNGWTCSYCGPRKAKRARRAITGIAESLNLRYFLTLTLDPANLAHSMGFDPMNLDAAQAELMRKHAVPYVRLCFNKFREYLRRRFGVPPKYICVLEFTQRGIPHLHVLFDRYIEQEWISEVWEALGAGRIVFIKRVTMRKVARYLSKYLTKELLLSAPKGARRITTARSIKLFPKFDSGIAWELLRESIWNVLARHRFHGCDGQGLVQQSLFQFVTWQPDEEGFLISFQLHNTT